MFQVRCDDVYFPMTQKRIYRYHGNRWKPAKRGERYMDVRYIIPSPFL